MSEPQTLLPQSLGAFALALRRYRQARRMSQLDLALACNVSARHLSFLESSRAQPSREMVLQLAAGLLLPLGARNLLLQAAGFAPVYPASPLDGAALQPFRTILTDMMSRHAPAPALVYDRHWTVREANAAADGLLALLDTGAAERNLVRMLAESPQAPQFIVNLPDVLAELYGRVQIEALEAGDDPLLHDLMRLLDEARRRHPQSGPALARSPVLPLIAEIGGMRLSFLTVVAHFGTSEDVTIRDLRLELLFPADGATRQALGL